MSASLSHGSSAEPNLTPILDMVFQLITFFMLVINFKSAAMDLSLKLPVIGSAQPVDMQGQEDLLVLNIDSTGKLNVFGVEKDIDRYIATEAQVSRLTARLNPSEKGDDDLRTIVVVRADRATPFHLLNRVIKVCQEHGFRRFSLKAMNRKEEI
ncbi:MAG TPA: biopolymer transporter ExbD [Pirellulales bacterium]|jgi:biopolymer transport protein ExbD|nr:biopolymer transporter ExbD [Pirellulales bacterium]